MSRKREPGLRWTRAQDVQFQQAQLAVGDERKLPQPQAGSKKVSPRSFW